jgi:hypothetical protein
MRPEKGRSSRTTLMNARISFTWHHLVAKDVRLIVHIEDIGSTHDEPQHFEEPRDPV